MSIEDYFDNWAEPDDWEEPRYVTCKYCGMENLLWEEFPRGWRLVDEDAKIHNCREDFEVIDENI